MLCWWCCVDGVVLLVSCRWCVDDVVLLMMLRRPRVRQWRRRRRRRRDGARKTKTPHGNVGKYIVESLFCIGAIHFLEGLFGKVLRNCKKKGKASFSAVNQLQMGHPNHSRLWVYQMLVILSNPRKWLIVLYQLYRQKIPRNPIGLAKPKPGTSACAQSC